MRHDEYLMLIEKAVRMSRTTGMLTIVKHVAMFETYADDARKIAELCKIGIVRRCGVDAVCFNRLGESIYTKKLNSIGIEYVIVEQSSMIKRI